MAGHAATIRKLRLKAYVPRDHPAPDAARVKLADAVRRDLSSRLAARFDGDDTDRVILIRKLAVHLTVDAARTDDRVADLLAEAISLAIADARRAPKDDVVLFEDKGALLAAYLVARLEGGADRWWFRSFADLAPLPESIALRIAILAEPHVGQSALARMTPRARRRLIDTLSVSDAERIVAAFASEAGPGPDISAAAKAMCAGLEEAPAGNVVLHLYMSAGVHAPECAGESVLKAARAVAAVSKMAQNDAGALNVFVSGDAAALARIAPRSLADVLPLLAMPPPLRRTMAARIACACDASAHVHEENLPLRRHTAFGGLALLLPFLMDMEGQATAENHILRFLILCMAAGAERAGLVFADPFWRDLFAIDPHFGESEAALWLRAAPRETLRALIGSHRRKPGLAPPSFLRDVRGARALVIAARGVLADFARRLPGFAESSPEFLWRNLLGVPAQAEFHPDGVRMSLARPPLDVLLTITGLANRACRLPDGRAVILERGA